MAYDLIIIGAGPAGITAAIYAARRKIKFLLISLNLGGQIGLSPEVGNYPGVRVMSGPELVGRFQQHMKDYKIKMHQEEVVDIKKSIKIIKVKTRKKSYEAKAVIIASGKKPKKLEVPGEKELKNKGISYCATCDAPLFKNKVVAVIGGGNSALEAAIFLSKYAVKVYLININPSLGGEKFLKDKVLQNRKIKIINNSKTTEILGREFVSGLKYENQGKINTLKVNGIFIEIGLIPGCDFVKIVKKNNWGEIMIFRSTKTHEENMTNVPGVFAAGDVTDIPAKQIVVSAGEGAKAAIAAFNYIDKLKI